jgi:hypothetical protein
VTPLSCEDREYQYKKIKKIKKQAAVRIDATHPYGGFIAVTYPREVL